MTPRQLWQVLLCLIGYHKWSVEDTSHPECHCEHCKTPFDPGP